MLRSVGQVPTNIDSLKKNYRKNPETLENISLVAQAYLQVNPDSAYRYAKILLTKCNEDEYDYQARAYNVIGHYQLVYNKLDSSSYYYKKAIELTKKGNLNFIQGVYTINLAQNELNKGNVKSGIEKYKEAEKLLVAYNFEDRADYYLSIVYSGLGESYNYLSLYDIALENLFKSYKKSEKIQDYTNMGITLSTIADLYFNIQDYTKSDVYNRKSLAELRKTNYPLAEGMIYYNLAKNRYKLKQYRQSEVLLDSAMTILKKAGTEYGLSDIYNLYGQLYLVQEKYSLSENYFNKSLDMNVKSDAAVQAGNSMSGLGDLFKKKKEESKALAYYQKAFKVFEKEDMIKEKKEILEKIIGLQSILSQKDSLVYYVNLYKKESDAYLNKEKQQAIIGQEILYDTEIKEAKIKSQELQLEREKSKRYKLNYLFGITSLIILFSLLWYFNRQKQKELQSKNTVLGMQHQLTKMELQNLNQQFNPHEFKNLLAGLAPEIQEKAPQAYRHMIKLLNLTKATIEHNTLTDSVDNQLKQIESYLVLQKNVISIPLDWEIQNDLPNPEFQIPRLLLKNLVENAVKHGIRPKQEGGKVTVKLYEDKQYINISVSDDGVGRGATQTSDTGVGISTYQKLFFSLNTKNDLQATLHFVDKSQGTEVKIKIPLNYLYT